MRKLLLPVLLATVLMWAGCGGGKSNTSSTAVTIAISPTTATVQGGQTQQFTATLTNTTNMGVTWEVNGTAGGNAVVGTITTTGLYTAPTTLPSPANVTVTAVSQADTTKTAMATVTLTTPTITVTISPTAATLVAGATQQFTATVAGNSNTAVNWTVNGVAGGSPTLGTVDATGLYTAPASPPKEGITVFAVSQADTTRTAAATVTAEFGNASLNGTYVFLATQPDNHTGTGFAFRGGTFVADGAGNLTSGIEDENSSGTTPLTNVAFTGTYTIGTDGRGMATINDPSANKFSFALISSTRGQIIAFDTPAVQVTTGFIQQQDQTAIASAKGTFVFSFFGDNTGPVAEVGNLLLDGAGNITGGSEDVNSHGTIMQNVPLAGTYTVGAGGHGTATVGAAHFVFYIVDASTLAFLGTDPAGAVAGTAFAQTGGPFTAANLGTSVFLVSGNTVTSGGGFAQAGVFSTDGASSLTSGVFDQNNAGALTSNSAVTGTYTLASTGRGQLSFNNQTFIFWLASPSKAVLMEADGIAVADGLLLKQTGEPFQSVAGGYAFSLAGSDVGNTTPFAEDGQLSTAGFGVLSGNADVNQTSQQSFPLSGNLALTTNGRGTGAISAPTSVNYDFYFASPDQFFLLSADAKTVLSGMAHRQCSDCQ